jgi:hypothetical protein
MLTLAMWTPSSVKAQEPRQYYEVRSYVLGEKGDSDAIDQYLKAALLPALQRQGIGPVGVFTNSPNDETGSARIIVVIPYASADQIANVKAGVDGDATYQSVAKSYLDRNAENPPYQRIESELLVAMDCFPKLQVQNESLSNKNRVYEFRIYESPNERLGDLKVDMFNSGEVPIFLASGIQPIFIGQAVVGPYTPSLSYLTVYQDEPARLEAWKAFREHPDWLVLKDVPKYQGTVSKIHKYVLNPTPYSQM